MKTINPWYRNENNNFSPKYFDYTHSKIVFELNEYKIIRVNTLQWDYIKGDVTISQRAGKNIDLVKSWVDGLELSCEAENYHLVQRPRNNYTYGMSLKAKYEGK